MLERLSTPREVYMADEWFQIATLSHFWIDWRFKSLTKNSSLLPPDNAKILDVGCGSGLLLRQLRELKPDYILHGCDLNERALSFADGEEYKLFVYDICERAADMHEQFDAVFLMDVLEHIVDDAAFLGAASFHLKAGGRVYINVPAHQWLYSRYDEVVGHQRRYSFEALSRVLISNKLSIKKIVPWGFSLLPVAILRKLVLNFVARDKVTACGFEPPNAFAQKGLDLVKTIELKLFDRVPAGTSLLAIAEKN